MNYHESDYYVVRGSGIGALFAKIFGRVAPVVARRGAAAAAATRNAAKAVGRAATRARTAATAAAGTTGTAAAAAGTARAVGSAASVAARTVGRAAVVPRILSPYQGLSSVTRGVPRIADAIARSVASSGARTAFRPAGIASKARSVLAGIRKGAKSAGRAAGKAARTTASATGKAAKATASATGKAAKATKKAATTVKDKVLRRKFDGDFRIKSASRSIAGKVSKGAKKATKAVSKKVKKVTKPRQTVRDRNLLDGSETTRRLKDISKNPAKKGLLKRIKAKHMQRGKVGASTRSSAASALDPLLYVDYE